MEVLASDGDVELGGSDFDLMIANKIKKDFFAEHEIDLSTNPIQWARVLCAAEKAKIKLSSEAEAEILEEFLAEKAGIPLHLKTRITRYEFEEMIRPALERTISSVDRALKQASCDASSLDRVILVGGSTYIPLVSQLLEEALGIAPQAWLNPETIVAQGAAIEGSCIKGESLGTIMLDITSHSIGIGAVKDFFVENAIMIRRNSSLPYSTSRLFYKTYPAQDAVEITVYQGESPFVEENEKIDTFRLEGLKESEGMGICVKLEMDRSAILHVTATDVDSGKSITHTIKKESASFVRSENLADLKMLKIQENAASMPVTEDSQEDLVQVDEEVINRALQILNRDSLDEENKKELQEALELVKKGEPSDKLKEILYYLD
jgi:molecular chaperone DnaK